MSEQPWIETRSGKHFSLFEPREEDIDLEDIVWALSHQCRYAGHCSKPYSVLEHSIWVSTFLPPSLVKWGLLHDAAEAYLPDLPSPWKRHPSFRFYVEAEERLMEVIARKFGLEWPVPPLIKQADEFLLWYEGRELGMGEWALAYEEKYTGWHWGRETSRPPEHLLVGCFTPGSARDYFWDLWRAYGG